MDTSPIGLITLVGTWMIIIGGIRAYGRRQREKGQRDGQR